MERFSCVAEKTRKRFRINVTKTKDRVEERVLKYSVKVSSHIGNDANGNVDKIFMFSVAVKDHQFILVRSLVPLTPAYSQKMFELHTVVTGFKISTHAVARFLERNNTTDIDKALSVIGAAIEKCDRHLGALELFENKIAIGEHNKTIQCSDGGAVFIIIKDPSEGNYRKVEWIVSSYISKDMVKHWNEKAMIEEFNLKCNK